MFRDERPLPVFERTHAVDPAVTRERFERLVECVNRIPYEDDAEYCPTDSAGWWKIGTDPRCLVEEVARELHYYVRQSYRETDDYGSLRRVAPELVGAEWWVRLGRCSDDHPFHVDKSERLYEETGLVRHPYYGGVLYTGDVGGPTRILNEWLLTERVPGEQRVSPGSGFVVPAEKIVGTRSAGNGDLVDVHPKPNRYLIFPGWARHGVCPTKGSGVRRTVLFNWWCWEPPGMKKDPVFLPGESR